MMLKFNVYMSVLILSSSISSQKEVSINVGSVVFRFAELNKRCWTQDRMSLLAARCILDALIPQYILNACNGVYISTYINYVTRCFDIIRANTAGKNQELMVLAMADTVGGYLKVYLLPITRLLFYAGYVPYDEAAKLVCIYEEIKLVLRTNGKEWRAPLQMSKTKLKILPLQITPPSRGVNACSDFIIENDNKSHVVIPIPFLDNNTTPKSVVVPLKFEGLRSLDAASSHFLLVNYYIASTKCLISRDVSFSNIIEFNRNFSLWLQQAVIPHLEEEKWYPAFGGVLQIFETMKRLRIDVDRKHEHTSSSVKHNVSRPPNAANSSEEATTKFPTKDGIKLSPIRPEAYVLIAFVSASIFWCSTGLIFLFSYSCLRSRNPPVVSCLYFNTENQ